MRPHDGRVEDQMLPIGISDEAAVHPLPEALVTSIVFRANLFQPLSEYRRRADEMAQRTRAVPPAPGFKEVLLTGMLEDRAQEARRRDGIPIADDIWKSIVDTAASMGVKV